MAKGLRHIGTQGRNPLLFLGYQAGRNEVAVIDLKLLRPEEATWLTEFISQDHVYNAKTLSEPMNQAAYTPGVNAFAHFLSRATPLPLYEVSMTDKDQCYEWTKTDSRYSQSIPDHPFISRIRELMEARKNGTIPAAPPITTAPDSSARSGEGDVMDTVRKFFEQTGQTAAFIAKEDPNADKSGDGTADRLAALEARFDRIEKLLTGKSAAKPARTLKRAGSKK